MRLIDADALKKLVAGWACFIREDYDTMWTCGIEEAIDNFPTVEERKTGKWIVYKSPAIPEDKSIYSLPSLSYT